MNWGAGNFYKLVGLPSRELLWTLNIRIHATGVAADEDCLLCRKKCNRRLESDG